MKGLRLIDNTNPYLTFQLRDLTPRKTQVLEVIAVRDGTLLGTIRWWGPWRQYVFAPEPECVFNASCLETIKKNVSILTTGHRLERSRSTA